MGAVTYIDEARKNRTFRWDWIKLLRSAVIESTVFPLKGEVRQNIFIDQIRTKQSIQAKSYCRNPFNSGQQLL